MNARRTMVDELYLIENLPDGWNYDCYWGDEMPSHFVIFAPDGIVYRHAFQWISSTGEYISDEEVRPAGAGQW